MISNGKSIEELKKNFIAIGKKLDFIAPVKPKSDKRLGLPAQDYVVMLERARGKLYPLEWLFHPDRVLEPTPTTPSTQATPTTPSTQPTPSTSIPELAYIKMMTPLLEDTSVTNSGIRVLFTDYDELTHTDYAVVYSDARTLGISLSTEAPTLDPSDSAFETDSAFDPDLEAFEDPLSALANSEPKSWLEYSETFPNFLNKGTETSPSPLSYPKQFPDKYYQEFFMVVHLLPDHSREWINWVVMDFDYSFGYRKFAVTDDYIKHLYRVVYNTSDYYLPSIREMSPGVFYNDKYWKIEGIPNTTD